MIHILLANFFIWVLMNFFLAVLPLHWVVLEGTFELFRAKQEKMCPQRIEFHKKRTVLFTSFSLPHTYVSRSRYAKTEYLSSIDTCFGAFQPSHRGSNGVNDMQNIWVRTGFPDANYHVICHIMLQKKTEWGKKRAKARKVVSKVFRLACMPMHFSLFPLWTFRIFCIPVYDRKYWF